MTRPPIQRFHSRFERLGLALCVVAVIVARVEARAAAADAPAKITKLNQEALDAFDNLNFDQAKTLLEQALDEGSAAGLAASPLAARSHLNLGMLLIAGFQQREEAIAHFKLALKIQPDIVAAPGLFNPEVQAAFDEAKANLKTEPAPQSHPETASAGKTAQASTKAGNQTEGQRVVEGNGSDGSEGSMSASRFFLSLGIGSGLGVAKGHLDANSGSVQDSSWSGGLAPSRLGHLGLSVGYFLSPNLLVSLDGRLQIVSGTTTVNDTPACVTPCSAPSTGIAVLANVRWFLSGGPLRPFVGGGLGAGTIRQVVKINVQTPGQPTQVTGCGDSRTETCVDTVTGGPVLFGVGGGLMYEIGKLALLGSLTANVGIPKVMLNVDALLGLGLRL